MRRIILACALAGILAAPAFGQGVDPLIGSWKLNIEKSVSSTPLQRSVTATWSGEGQNLVNNAEGVDAQGRPFHFVFRFIYDGMPHPTTGDPNYDASAYNRIGNTINSVRFKQGKVVQVGQAVIVPGKTYTLSVEGIDVNNQPYHSVMVFDRQ